MASTFEQRFNWLRMQGLLEFEAWEFADSYSLTKMRELSYFRLMLNRRVNYIRDLRKLGLTDNQIVDRIITYTYNRRKWHTAWDLLRYWRDKTIKRTDDLHYTSPKRKGSHHPPDSGVSKGDLKSQRQRRKKKLSNLEKYDKGRMR